MYKERNVEGKQKERSNPELIAAAGKDVGGFPVDVLGVFNQKILRHHAVVCWGWNGKLQTRVCNTTAGGSVANFGLGIRRDHIFSAFARQLNDARLFQVEPFGFC